MQTGSETTPKLMYLNPKFLQDVETSCIKKCSQGQYTYLLGCVEKEIEIVTRTMSNSTDCGFGFLKLAIHPGSSPSSMAIIYDKIINQTQWKYRKTALSFVEAIDTLFKFSTKNQDVLKKFAQDSQLGGDKASLLEAVSEITIMYIARLVNQEKFPLAS